MTIEEIKGLLGRPPTQREFEIFNGINCSPSLTAAMLAKFKKEVRRPFVQPAQESRVAAGPERHFHIAANGIGDTLLGLHAICGAAAQFGGRIVYHTKQGKWAKLFWNDVEPLATGLNSPNLNAGYQVECRSKAQVPRWQRYCINANPPDGVHPLIPSLLDEDYIKAEQSKYAGYAALIPRSVYANRNWPHESWLRLERMLMDRGYKTVVLHDKRLDGFVGEQFTNRTPREVAGVLCNSSVVVRVHCSDHAF